jgi:hypothetical protein
VRLGYVRSVYIVFILGQDSTGYVRLDEVSMP